ncbi:MAG: cell division protein FtsQ/DivIB [Bacteroidetes bacterium]|nr:cell division protein FtsQ/DivIB [Bacteroidota bacterium]
MNTKVKISSIIFLSMIVAGIAYMSFFLDEQKPDSIAVIEMNGNILLPKDIYYEFAQLNDKNAFPELSAKLVADRLEKHPYIKSVDVLHRGSKLEININEKEFAALLFKSQEQVLITSYGEIIPVLPFTRQMNYPIINEPKLVNEIKHFKSAYKHGDIVTGLKIIDVVKLLNADLYESLSEVDLRDGKDILVYFSNFPYPIVVGRGNEIRKMIYFEKLWQHFAGKELNGILNYVDLRYNKLIYLGVDPLNDDNIGSQS